MGYDFTGGRIFDLPIDFCMGLTTVIDNNLTLIQTWNNWQLNKTDN